MRYAGKPTAGRLRVFKRYEEEARSDYRAARRAYRTYPVAELLDAALDARLSWESARATAKAEAARLREEEA